MIVDDWRPWFAWRPVRSLYTTRLIWLCWGQRRHSSIDGRPMYREGHFKGSAADIIRI